MAGGTTVRREAKSLVDQKILVITSLALFLGGCLESGESSDGFVNGGEPEPNNVPTISGVPATTVAVGDMYSFTPNATDADNDKLTFSIQNKPGWAVFDSASGRLSGQPSLGDEGAYNNIRISVSDGKDSASTAGFNITVEDDSTPSNNSAPVISGNPPVLVTVGNSYSFTPGASDADGDMLTFSIQNQPAWASFDTGTGQLSGQPSTGDVGIYSNILISVSDGHETDSLNTFAITVEDAALFSATLSWTAPTQNDDGTALTDLAGYKLYWGTTPGIYTDSATIDNPGITTYVVENLPAGTYEFVTTAYNSARVESDYSTPATMVLN
jgi:hypothetical protein